MKRSEFLEQIRTGKHPTDKHETVFEYFAREAVVAAEAAGVVWDPEDEPLPDKLVYGPIAEGLNFRPALAPVEPRRGWSSREQELRGYAEAVRRYNAWPELEKLAVGDFGDDRRPRHWSDRLRDILRGGAS